MFASSQFPDVFQYNKTVAGFCFVSTGTIPVSIGGKPFYLTTVSAWTNEFLPAFPPGAPLGTDNLGTVVSQVTVYNAYNRAVGNIFTRDTIDLSRIIAGTGYTSSEQDVIVGGSGIFQNVQGAYRIDSGLDPSGAVDLTNITGSICNIAGN